MDAIGEQHHSMIQQWQRMAASQQMEQHYVNQPGFILPQSNIDNQSSPVSSMDGTFPYPSSQNDSKYSSALLMVGCSKVDRFKSRVLVQCFQKTLVTNLSL